MFNDRSQQMLRALGVSGISVKQKVIRALQATPLIDRPIQ